MLNIFLIVLMLTGIVVFSLQPADKTTDNIATSTNEDVATQKTKTTIVTNVTTAIKPATVQLLLTRGREQMVKSA